MRLDERPPHAEQGRPRGRHGKDTCARPGSTDRSTPLWTAARGGGRGLRERGRAERPGLPGRTGGPAPAGPRAPRPRCEIRRRPVFRQASREPLPGQDSNPNLKSPKDPVLPITPPGKTGNPLHRSRGPQNGRPVPGSNPSRSPPRIAHEFTAAAPRRAPGGGRPPRRTAVPAAAPSAAGSFPARSRPRLHRAHRGFRPVPGPGGPPPVEGATCQTYGLVGYGFVGKPGGTGGGSGFRACAPLRVARP